jgi:hypothetical protein
MRKHAALVLSCRKLIMEACELQSHCTQLVPVSQDRNAITILLSAASEGLLLHGSCFFLRNGKYGPWLIMNACRVVITPTLPENSPLPPPPPIPSPKFGSSCPPPPSHRQRDQQVASFTRPPPWWLCVPRGREAGCSIYLLQHFLVVSLSPAWLSKQRHQQIVAARVAGPRGFGVLQVYVLRTLLGETGRSNMMNKLHFDQFCCTC